jgi:acetyl-CoA carboxylase biotin carboxyl carrier protein
MKSKNGKSAAADKSGSKPTERVEELLELMNEQDLLELEISDGTSEVKLSKQSYVPMASLRSPAAGGAHAGPAASSAPKAVSVESEKGTPINSPLAGVFYRAQSPTSPPFVKEGDIVTPERVLCIIEAMKVLNEINAGVHGKITRIMLENGKPVSSGQPIFYVEPV